MAMTDGNPTQEVQEIRELKDTVGQIVAQMQRQSAASEKKESRFETKIKSLLSTGTVDKENLAAIADIIEAKAADTKDEVSAKQSQNNVQSMQAKYAEAVSDALEKYIDGDEKLEKKLKTFQFETLENLAADTAVMRKFNAGQLDKHQIKAAAKEVVESYSKEILGRDKGSKGPAMNQGVPGAVASQAIENSPPAGSIDDITEPHRREAYLKLKSAGQRWGKMTPEAADKWAYGHATRPYKKAGSAA